MRAKMQAAKPKAASASELTPRKLRFIEEYLIDLNGKQAAIRAGYSATRAEVTASELLADRKVSDSVNAALAKRSERTQITADAVLQDLWMIARADPREIMEHRRCCCRYCWGKDFRYQRTAGEMERDKAEHAQRMEDARRNTKLPKPRPFDVKGGTGYNPKRDPHADCPECFGEGVGETFFHDTRKLSPAAARLFAGVKQTKEGLELKTHSQDDALVNVGRHLGLFTDKLKIDATVKGSVSYKANIPAR